MPNPPSAATRVLPPPASHPFSAHPLAPVNILHLALSFVMEQSATVADEIRSFRCFADLARMTQAMCMLLALLPILPRPPAELKYPSLGRRSRI
jgi:hypothetical protein